MPASSPKGQGHRAQGIPPTTCEGIHKITPGQVAPGPFVKVTCHLDWVTPFTLTRSPAMRDWEEQPQSPPEGSRPSAPILRGKEPK